MIDLMIDDKARYNPFRFVDVFTRHTGIRAARRWRSLSLSFRLTGIRDKEVAPHGGRVVNHFQQGDFDRQL